MKEEAHVEIALGASVWDSTTGATAVADAMRRNSTASAAALIGARNECPGLQPQVWHWSIRMMQRHFEELQRTLAP